MNERQERPIAAIATAPGLSGVAIVRVSGPGCLEVARRVFHKKARGPYQSHRMYYGRAQDGERPIDEAMGVFFRGPRSYTGEDAFEIQCHGGSVAASAVLSALLNSGCRLAEPGEFTKRAFLNGRLSLDEAEAVMDFIGARTDAAARSALSRMEGALLRRLGPVEEGLLDMAASLEALLDYPDEDVEQAEVERALAGLDAALETLGRAIASAPALELLQRGVRVVLFGAPNAGKSSLLNALLERRRAIVTDQPGTTRDVLREELSLRGLPVVLSDTAGLRRAEGLAEEQGVALAKDELSRADLGLLVLDSSLDELPELPALSCPLVVALNKGDLPARLSEEAVERALHPSALVRTCALTGEGVDRLREALYELAVGQADVEDAALAGERQVELAKQAQAALLDAKQALPKGQLDLAAIALRQAYGCLGRLFGREADERVIDRIFEKFCLGK